MAESFFTETNKNNDKNAELTIINDWLKSSKDLREFKKKITSILNCIGISSWEFTALDTPSCLDNEEQIGMNFKDEIRVYRKNAYHEYELMIQHVIKTGKPIFKSTVDNFLNTEDIKTENFKKNIDLFQKISEQGYNDYCYLPAYSSIDKSLIMLTVCTKNISSLDLRKIVSCNSSFLGNLLLSIDAVGSRLFPEYFYQSRKQYTNLKNSKPVELLNLMYTQDISLKEAAYQLGIKYSTADKHLQKLRDILGTKTTLGAIKKARQKKLLK